ncbi:unnamed protein product [Rhodiola kirilowii]
MDLRKIVVVVEDVDAARTALRWALHNLLRHGDVLTLLHVFSPPPPSPRSARKLRMLRLNAFQLALSFKDICCLDFPNTMVDMVVRDGDQEGRTIAALVREIGTSVLVIGLHHHSFLYRLAMTREINNFNCRVVAIKHPHRQLASKTSDTGLDNGSLVNFSQIEISGLELPAVHPPKIRYQICPSPYGIIWRRSRKIWNNMEEIKRNKKESA